MSDLHNWDSLPEISLPHAVDLVCDVAQAEPERFTSVTFPESEAEGEEFLLRAAS